MVVPPGGTPLVDYALYFFFCFSGLFVVEARHTSLAPVTDCSVNGTGARFGSETTCSELDCSG